MLRHELRVFGYLESHSVCLVVWLAGTVCVLVNNRFYVRMRGNNESVSLWIFNVPSSDQGKLGVNHTFKILLYYAETDSCLIFNVPSPALRQLSKNHTFKNSSVFLPIRVSFLVRAPDS